MKILRSMFAAALVCAAITPAAFAGHTHVTTPSTWTLDAKASDFGGGPSMKSDVTVILTDTDQWLNYTDVTVDGDGKTWKTSWSGPANGTAKPVTGMPGATFSVNAAEDSQVFTMPDGTTMSSTFVLSSDKKTITFTGIAKTKDGKTFRQKLVYRRTA